jgi:hypothetical protein
MNLNELRDEALRIAVEHGFKDASIGEDVALLHSEASELLEDHRGGARPTRVWYESKASAFDPNGLPLGGDADEGQAKVVLRHREQMLVDGVPTRKPCGIPSELADIIIRVLHFSGKHGIDIERAVYEKMAYNRTRPFKHGGKKL